MSAMNLPELPEAELDFRPIRAQGPGGQHVNKVETAVQLRFDIGASSLPEPVKARLLRLRDARIHAGGIIVIKAQRYRSQADNRADALARLQALIRSACLIPKTRKPTQPTRAARERRLEAKERRSRLKALRVPPGERSPS